tara:strand:+ start:2071 stop:2286 length:216 start_codon:yes stop_codon:yes gene_type:complete
MGSENLTVLEITDIIWDHTVKSEELPEELNLQWDSNEWDYNQVLNWLSGYFKVTVNSFNVKELEEKRNSGG